MAGDAGIAPEPLAKLRAIVDAFPGIGFAVVDGGHFPDLPADFRRERLFARSLFLDNADPEVQAAGPWLVALGQSPDATDKVFALVGDKPAAVFWCCDAGEMELWRHLRGLNMARIPMWAANGQREPPIGAPRHSEVEAVIFRHYDPSVLMALMPALNAAQFARFLRPAREVAFCAEYFNRGPARVVADVGWPPTPAGQLTITTPQLAVLSDRRLIASHNRTVAYLREVAGGYISHNTDEAVLRHVQHSYRIGNELGLRTEGAHSQWALIMVLTQGRIVRYEPAREFIANGPYGPDRQLNELVRLTIEALQQQRNRLGESQ